MSTYINLANGKDGSRLGRKQKTFSSLLANLCQLVPDSNYTDLLLFWQVRTGGKSLLDEKDRIPDALDQSRLILPNNLFSRFFAGFQISRSLCKRNQGFDFSLSEVSLSLFLCSPRARIGLLIYKKRGLCSFYLGIYLNGVIFKAIVRVNQSESV